MRVALIVSVLVAFGEGAQAANFAECVLDRLPGIANAPAAFAALRSCQDESPGGYTTIAKGSGRGWFGFKDANACIVKKSKDTVQVNAAFMIAAACRCLYSTPAEDGEACASEPLGPVR